MALYALKGVSCNFRAGSREAATHFFDFFGENITAPACYIFRNIIGYGGALVDQIAVVIVVLCIKLGTIGIYDSYTGRIRLLGKVFFDFA